MMGTKNNPAKFDCYANALPDEPYFVLLARDESAPDMIEHWAFNRLTAIAMGQKPESDRAMVEEAVALAHQMRQWRLEHDGEWRTDKT
jgi:hypothetical protein